MYGGIIAVLAHPLAGIVAGVLFVSAITALLVRQGGWEGALFFYTRIAAVFAATFLIVVFTGWVFCGHAFCD